MRKEGASQDRQRLLCSICQIRRGREGRHFLWRKPLYKLAFGRLSDPANGSVFDGYPCVTAPGCSSPWGPQYRGFSFCYRQLFDNFWALRIRHNERHFVGKWAPARSVLAPTPIRFCRGRAWEPPSTMGINHAGKQKTADTVRLGFTGCGVVQQVELAPLGQPLGVDHHISRRKLAQCLQQPLFGERARTDNRVYQIVDCLTLSLDQRDQLIHCSEQASLGSRSNILAFGLEWATGLALLRPEQIRCKMHRERFCQRCKFSKSSGPVIINHWQFLFFIVLDLSIVECMGSCKHFFLNKRTFLSVVKSWVLRATPKSQLMPLFSNLKTLIFQELYVMVLLRPGAREKDSFDSLRRSIHHGGYGVFLPCAARRGLHSYSPLEETEMSTSNEPRTNRGITFQVPR
jgi:hypothetical protein